MYNIKDYFKHNVKLSSLERCDSLSFDMLNLKEIHDIQSPCLKDFNEEGLKALKFFMNNLIDSRNLACFCESETMCKHLLKTWFKHLNVDAERIPKFFWRNSQKFALGINKFLLLTLFNRPINFNKEIEPNFDFIPQAVKKLLHANESSYLLNTYMAWIWISSNDFQMDHAHKYALLAKKHLFLEDYPYKPETFFSYMIEKNHTSLNIGQFWNLATDIVIPDSTFVRFVTAFIKPKKALTSSR